MAVNELRLHEFDPERPKTKTTPARMPNDKWDWKSHEKSGALAGGRGTSRRSRNSPIPTVTSVRREPPRVNKDADLRGLFAKVSEQAHRALAGLRDEQLNETGSLKHNGQTLFAGRRDDMLGFNHPVHRRGHLTMYARELASRCRRIMVLPRTRIVFDDRQALRGGLQGPPRLKRLAYSRVLVKVPLDRSKEEI